MEGMELSFELFHPLFGMPQWIILSGRSKEFISLNRRFCYVQNFQILKGEKGKYEY